ncbi:alpha/beta hydrolase family protein [Lutimonas zeaxanthinifaciens]|uniref:alpha/beta hydrolase family protein n=1 Tax=Lutimonas zeaxanthinifaciens TaxID=3060215 RepID=UPI00265CA12F|nr:prolyl oligopeptidase family serine peptidase [Lutimonas sp. YSD2104]WKK67099.1 prolyl oligopeptidase family serine peptidase [Lutimonas sp. YSD2104]
MRKGLFKLIVVVLILLIGMSIGIFLGRNNSTLIIKPMKMLFKKYLLTKNSHWGEDFNIVEIKSSKDNTVQKSYFYKSKSSNPKPLIVSLHAWSGDFSENDRLAEISVLKDLNYIHPNFRGPNNEVDACCSELAVTDIDDAITYAINNSNVDNGEIYVIGLSGGGYATFCAFMKSKHRVKKFSAWASISDLVAWYNESKIRNNQFATDILDCTGSENGIDIKRAKERSPLYWQTPIEKLKNSKLTIYAGVYDGVKGSVPITHSFNFYNKILSEISVEDTSLYVSNYEKLKLLEKREKIAEFGKIGDREIYLKKEFINLSIIIFEGDHEILPEFAINDLLKD